MNKAKTFQGGIQVVVVDNKPHDLLQEVAGMTKAGTAKIGSTEHDIYMSGSPKNISTALQKAILQQITDWILAEAKNNPLCFSYSIQLGLR